MRSLHVVAAAASGLAISAIVSRVSGQGTGYFALLWSACTASFVSILFLYNEFKSCTDCSAEADEFMKCLGRMSYYRSSGMTLSKSLGRAAASSPDAKVSSLMRNVSRRTGLGDDLGDAIAAALRRERRLSAVLSRYMKSHDQTVEESVSMYESRRREKVAAANSLSARYATLNMFLSTIAPSFVMFSFIGSMLISQESGGIGFMSIAMIAAIPSVYSMVNFASSRGLIG